MLTQRLLPALRRAASEDDPARIINVTSIDGISPPRFESYAYSASKAGCLMLTRHLAKRLAREHILVNAIAPGFFRSKMTDAPLDECCDEVRSEEHTSELQSPMRISYAVFCLKN